MKTTFLAPPQSIARFVSGILIIENFNDRHEFILPLFANGSPTLVFQTARAIKNKQTVGHLSLYGQTIQPDVLTFKEDFTFIAYFFHPYSLKTLFGIQPAELTNGYLDISLLKQAKEYNIQERLLNADSIEESLQLIEQFILKLSADKEPGDEKIVIAVNILTRNNGIYPLSELQNSLHLTERSFQRLFGAHIGISPNLYRRICQFQFAFQQVNQNKFLKLTDVAYDSSFADQSHFIRVFKEFTGLTPNEYLAQLIPYRPQF